MSSGSPAGPAELAFLREQDGCPPDSREWFLRVFKAVDQHLIDFTNRFISGHEQQATVVLNGLRAELRQTATALEQAALALKDRGVIKAAQAAHQQAKKAMQLAQELS